MYRQGCLGTVHYMEQVVSKLWNTAKHPHDFLPLLLGKGLLPHGQMLLVLHEPQQWRIGFDAQPIIVVFGVPSEKNYGMRNGTSVRKSLRPQQQMHLWNLSAICT